MRIYCNQPQKSYDAITEIPCADIMVSWTQVIFYPEDISMISMQAGGSMALILARMYTERISLVGG